MSSDVHVAPSDVRAGVYLRIEHFARIARLLGHTSDAALGRAIGMTDRTISRAREGIIGEQFIAAVLSTFGQHEEELRQYNLGVKFEDLFEVREKAASA